MFFFFLQNCFFPSRVLDLVLDLVKLLVVVVADRPESALPEHQQEQQQQTHISFVVRTKNEDKMHQPGNAEALYPSLLTLGRRQRPREREERDVFFFEFCLLRHGWVSMPSRRVGFNRVPVRIHRELRRRVFPPNERDERLE